MRTGNRQRVASRQDVLGQPLRARGVFTAFVQDSLDRGIATRERIAHHDFIAVRRNILRQVALRERNAQSFQLRGHGRIDGLVTAFNHMPKLTRQHGNAAHESTGNTEDMEFSHGGNCR